MSVVKQILVSGIIMLLLDAIYLSTFGNFFNRLITSIQGFKIRFKLLGAIVCYALLIGGLNYFILNPRRSLSDAFFLGLVIYGVYETTSYAILEKWTLEAVALDTLWGGILFVLTTFFTRQFLNTRLYGEFRTTNN
jgi:uncharacterized membrane protein